MTYGKPKHVRRCLCHKLICTSGAFGEGIFCAKTRDPILKNQTYIATMDSDEEVMAKVEDRVQRGCVVDE